MTNTQKIEQLCRATLLLDKVACLTLQDAQLLTSRTTKLIAEAIYILWQFLALSPSCDWSIVCLHAHEFLLCCL